MANVSTLRSRLAFKVHRLYEHFLWDYERILVRTFFIGWSLTMIGLEALSLGLMWYGEHHPTTISFGETTSTN